MIETNLAAQQSRFILTTPTSLAHTFRGLRKNRGVTTKELSGKLGVGKIYITQVECGFKKPSLAYWLKCAEYFDANPQWTKASGLTKKLTGSKKD